MELFLTLLVLYGLQCLKFLPCGAVAFIDGFGAIRVTSGPGWRFLHPLPSRSTLIASRFPLIEHEKTLRSRGLVGWFSDDGFANRGPELPPPSDPPPPVDVRGYRVRIGGRRFIHGVAHTHAESIASLLRALLREDDAGRHARIEARILDAMSLDRFKDSEERFSRATRDLAWVLDAYLALLVLGLPAFAIAVGAERALLLGLPCILLVHGSALALYFGAHRKLFPDASGERIEQLISAALYPPLLLRATQDLQNLAIAGFHPAVIAAAHPEGEAQRRFLRREISHTEPTAEATGPIDIHAIERGALQKLLEVIGESTESLRSEPERSDPLAKSYCPDCSTEYRLASGECADCRVQLRAFAASS